VAGRRVLPEPEVDGAAVAGGALPNTMRSFLTTGRHDLATDVAGAPLV
jgi:hypothetical protein